MRAYARARNQGEELDFLAVDRDSLSQLRSQMLSKTVIAIRAVLDLDPTISEEHREGIMQFAMDDSLTVANILREQSGNEVVSIEKAAKMLGKSKPTVERYIRSGLLTPIIPQGKTRAIGVSLKSIRDFGKSDSPASDTTQGQE